MESSLGNEAIVSKHGKVVKKDVLAPVIVNYAKYTPVDGGVRIIVVICVDMGGSVPNWVSNLIAKRHAQNPILQSNFMMSGKIEKDEKE